MRGFRLWVIFSALGACNGDTKIDDQTFDPWADVESEGSDGDPTESESATDDPSGETGSDTESDPTDAVSDTETSGSDSETDTDDGPPRDRDGDGYTSDVDCDDGNASIHPDASEICDGVDNDCDGLVDDDDTVRGQSDWYTDADGDGWGTGSATRACDAPSGMVAYDGDCDDSDAAYHPSAPEEDCTDPNDYNCDGFVGYADDDGDGWAACEDCDDGDAAINPDASETCDDVDQDCDAAVDEDATDTSKYWEDSDGDGYGLAGAFVWVCDQPAGYVDNKTDCDDADADISPDGEETCDGVDQDCDGTVDEGVGSLSTWYADADGDGFGDADDTLESCTEPSGYVSDADDCDDGDAGVNPDATDSCDGVDSNCDGTVDDAEDCPCDMDWDGDHAYLFCTETRSWTDAQSYCNSYGYNMAAPQDAAENAWVNKRVYKIAGASVKWWFGYNDRATEGTWEWEDGSTSTYTDWAAGEPNDAGSGEDCAQFGRFTNKGWNDEPCSSTFYFVCESE